MRDDVVIDGSAGEGGGQVLRSALALSLATGRALRIERVRARRERPGLLRQHLTAVEAAARIGDAEVEGAVLRSQQVAFRPRGVRAGRYRFAVGTAGSAALVLQTVLLPLCLAGAPSEVVVEGGTHAPWAPPWDFLERTFLPLVRRMGFDADGRIERRGFHPAGGGRIRVAIGPHGPLAPLDLRERGAVRRLSARILHARIPLHVAHRERDALLATDRFRPSDVAIEEALDSPGPGNAVVLVVECEHVVEVFTAFGRIGVRAEAVAAEAVAEMEAYLASGVPAGPHLADQLLLPMALGAGGTFRTVAPTTHASTNCDVIAAFLGARPQFLPEEGGTFRAVVAPRAGR